LDPNYFKTLDGGLAIRLEKIGTELPSQVPIDNEAYDTLEASAGAIQDAGLMAGATSATMSFFMGASLNLMFGILNMI
jgi:hypothetical protein